MNSVFENTSLIYSNNNNFVVNSYFFDSYESLFYYLNILLFGFICLYFFVLSFHLENNIF